jgi:diphthine-ammonia ligase
LKGNISLDIIKKPYFVSWSGGKDSCLALHRAAYHFGKPHFLLNMLTEDVERSRSHGLKKKILQAQADALGIPILFYAASWNDYENTFIAALKTLKSKGIEAGVFGDMQMKNQPNALANRQWAEHVCRQAEMVAIEPLWDETEEDLMLTFLASGIKTKIIAINSKRLDKKYLGQLLTKELMDEFTKQGVHPFGEEGEYHSVVFDSPLFSKPLNLVDKESVLKDNYWFLDVDFI